MLKRHIEIVTDLTPGAPGIPGLVGRSDAMRQLRTLVQRLARSTGSVLIVGASGTGKEMVARALHAMSNRASAPFVAVNCAAFPDSLIDSELFGHERGAFTGADQSHRGLFEAAHQGVLFLDEIGDVPASTQVRLLRALQEGEIRPVGSTKSRRVDVRVISATNVDLQLAMADGRVRQDLYYRLSTFRIDLPTLRVRGEDVLLLAEHFLRESSPNAPRLAPCAAQAIVAYHWPGNVRELKNAIQYAAALCDEHEVRAAHLPAHVTSAPRTPSGPRPAGVWLAEQPDELTFQEARREFEVRYFTSLLDATGWNLSAAARRSGLDRANLRRTLKRLDIYAPGRELDEV